MAEGTGYPAEWEADVVLRDGTTTHVRPIRPDDADALQAFHTGQSERSTYLRFFAPLERLPERDLVRFTHVDHRDRVALVAVEQVPDADGSAGERIIGVGRYDRVGPDVAEVAFNIADDHQGRGLGSVLLEHLAAAARERGVRRFTAEVLPQNGRMIAVFREAGYEVRQSLEDGVVSVSFAIDPSDRSIEVMTERETRAEAQSVRGLLSPRSVLVLGSPDAPDGYVDDRMLRRVIVNLTSVDGGPDVHVVGVRGEHPGAVAWPGVADVPRPVDLVVLALPAIDVVPAVRRLGPLGPHGVVVLSAGFAESGPDGLARQRELVRTARAGGMRVVGPGSFGVVRVAGERPFDASLAARRPEPGRVGLFCQSAPMAVPLLDLARSRGLGISELVSAGHRADVSGNDLMQFWLKDEATDVACLYLESIGNPRKFSRISRRLSSIKPVVVVASARAGQVPPPGHAVRATHTPRRTLEEMLRQSGVVRVDNAHQMLDVAQLLAHQPLPGGRRVAVVATSPSMGTLVADAAVAAGLVLAGPVALLPHDAPPDVVRSTLAAVYDDPGHDVVVVVHVPTVPPPETGDPTDATVAAELARAAAGSGRATVACLPGRRGLTAELTAADADGRAWTVPGYTTPDDAVLALGHAVRYAQWRRTDRGGRARPDGADTRAARRLVESWLADRAGATDVDAAGTAELLASVGIRVLPAYPAHDADEAVAAADRAGWPVALKTTVPALRHRTDLGGVRLDIANEAELRTDVAQVLALSAQHEPEPGRAPLEVQTMAPTGAACVLRTVEDPLFGPVIAFGLTGDASDLLGDVAYGVPPLTDVDVADLVRAPRAAPRLFGYRGLPPLDTGALEDLVARVAVLSDDVPEVHLLELNPVVVAEHGLTVLGARLRVGPAARTDSSRRALPA